MKQVLQNPRSGALELTDVPAPAPERGQILVRNAFSVMSPGTEKLAMDFARSSLLGKARSRPDLVRQVARKLRQEGPLATYRTVMDRLESPQPLGYATAGVVEAVGAEVSGFRVGDRVACAGAGYANHAELVTVPENLAAHVPEGVPLEAAAFTTLGAIAMQGVRVAAPQLGEIAAVVGLGLIGQIAAQLLRANGCRVLGIDVVPQRIEETLRQGTEWALRPGGELERWSPGGGEPAEVDLAVIAASAKNAGPLQQGAELCRMKGRISVIGAMPMELERRTFYAKELELRMSTSYGPGRYDPSYEELGLDYPRAYVRWTENRNMQAFLQLLAGGSLRTDLLPTETVPFEEAESAYARLAARESGALATIFRYPERPSSRSRKAVVDTSARKPLQSGIGIGFVGAGNYARGVLLPALRRVPELQPRGIATATGASAHHTARRFGFATCGTNPEDVIADPSTDLVVIATRHDTHAALAIRALESGKARKAGGALARRGAGRRAGRAEGRPADGGLQPAFLAPCAADPRRHGAAIGTAGVELPGRGRRASHRHVDHGSLRRRRAGGGGGVPLRGSVHLPRGVRTRLRLRPPSLR